MRFIAACGIYAFMTWMSAGKMDENIAILLVLAVIWGLIMDISEMVNKRK
jgi:hypothetical protein